MAFQLGNSGRPKAERAFASMLRIALAEANEAGGTKLRAVADALVNAAISGEVPAIKEIADRLDGKVPQAIVGDDEHDPMRLVHRIERLIVDPAPNTDSQGIPPAS